MSRPDRQNRKEKSPGTLVRKAIVASLTSKLRDQPEAYRALVEKGLVDPSILDDDQPDLDVIIRQFKDRISELVREEPSVMGRLDIRPLDVLCEQPSQPAPTVSEQRDSTVVFCDLEGFTSFTSARGDIEASALLHDHYEVVDAIVRSRGGRVVKTLGDGHMMSFSEPAAAVMASVDLVGEAPADLRLRAGAHSGLVVVTDQDLLGHVVNVAARVTGLADGGVSLVTTDVRDRVGRLPTIRFEPSRSERVAGLEAPVDVCEVHAS